jgi:hypothetical protein
MEAEHTVLLYYCETRWLSRVKAIRTVIELKDKIAIFLSGNAGSDDAHLFCSEDFIHKLAYLVDIF